MEPVDICRAKAEFSKLVRLAESGQDVIIARNGEPVARLTRLEPKKKPIVFGLLKGKIHITDDFDDPLSEDFLVTPEN
jgi:prevent-host-death family protein